MPPTRTVRQRAVNNENDENAAPARSTRAKATVAGGGMPDELSEDMVKKALQSKKNVSSASTQRKRAALGDVSNVVKGENNASKVTKKPVGRPALAPKASNNGVQKLSRTSSTRSPQAAKDRDTGNKRSSGSDLKRPASIAGVVDRAQKKRSTGSTTDLVSTAESAVPPPAPVPPVAEQQQQQQQEQQEEIKQGVKQELKQELKQEIKQEIKHELKRETPEVVQETVTTQRREATSNATTAEQRRARPTVLSQVADVRVPDLDAEDLNDPLMVAEYAAEIFEYLRELEVASMPNPDYMDHQDHIDWSDRDILNDWLVQVHQRFQLLPETFYLAINIIDRFLSTKIVQLDKLQLVGITAMFIASKYEEVISPHVSNFTYMAKDYQDSEILSAERFILAALNYDLNYPNPMNFLRRVSKADNYDVQTRTLAKYLMEVAVLDHRFLEYCPSHVAAASMYMARMILHRGEWHATLAHYSGYTEEELIPIFKLFLDYCCGEIKHDAFHNKYASKKYLKASLLVRQWSERYVAKLRARHSTFARDLQAR